MSLQKFTKFKVLSLLFFLTFFLSGCNAQLNQQRQLSPDYVPVQHGFIEYYKIGSGSPIILIPGYITDVTSWDRQFIATLSAHHQLYILNNRCVGGSVVHSSHYDIKDVANDAFQLMQNLQLQKPAVIGVSMGGMIAQQLAVLHPDKIKQLILINTAIAGKEAAHPSPSTEKILFNMPPDKLKRFKIALDLFFPASWRQRMEVQLIFHRFQPGRYSEVDLVKVMPQQRSLIQGWIKDNNTAKEISHLPMPVLILNGEADVILPPVNSTILAKKIPHAKLVRWRDGGHAMIFQYPVSLAGAVNEFIVETSA
jgi:pimeloyl-ACP methyl ester carboxylesterase